MRSLASLMILVLLVLLACAASAQPANENLYKAQGIFEELLQRTPDDPDIYKYLGDIHASLGDPAKAQEFYEKYVAMRPKDFYPYYRLGELSWAAGDRREAGEYFAKSLELISAEKGDLQTESARARMKALSNDKSGSDELFDAMIQENPNDPDLANLYIQTLLDTDRPKKAYVLADRYASQYPESYDLQRSRIRALIMMQRYREASSAISALMEKYPSDEGIKADRADALYGSGDWYNARPLFEELSKGNPENKYFRRTLDDIFRDYAPRLSGGFDVLLNGQDRRYGPFFSYLHPFDAKWAFEVRYMLNGNSTNVTGFNPNYWTLTNAATLLARYKPYRTVELTAGWANNMNGTSYQPAPIVSADWNDPTAGHFRVDFIYNDLFDDPVAGLYFGGKQDTAGFTYDRTFYDRVVFSAGYSSVWYRVDGSKTNTGLGNEFGRNDITDNSLQFIVLRKPQIRIGYQLYYSKLHVVNNYLNIIPLIAESLQNNILYGISYDWNDWIKTDFGGFVGNDSKRGIGFARLYGFNIANRVKVSRRLELIGHYEYSSSSLQNTLGRYQFFGVDFLYRF